MKFLNLKNPWMWTAVLALISVIFAFVHKFTGTDWSYTATIIPWIPLGIFAISAIIFAFIINPVKALIKKIKERKK
jgi:hypothetical protein